MAELWKLSAQGFQTTTVNMLRAPVDKVDSMQEPIDHVSREKEILRKNQKETLTIKNTVTEMKNAFVRLISKLDRAKNL